MDVSLHQRLESRGVSAAGDTSVKAVDGHKLEALECIRSLHFEGLGDRQRNINPAQAYTFEWIFSESKIGFLDWLHGEGGIFWITGKPGSGKSTLMKFLMGNPKVKTELSTRELHHHSKEPIIVGYFLDFNSGTLARSISGILRSLLWQVLQIQPALISTVLPRYRKKSSVEKRLAWSEQELEEVFLDVLKRCHDRNEKICVFIDALDEYGGDDDEIATFIKKISIAGMGQLLPCIASRPYPDFRYEFESFSKLFLEEETRNDINSYVSRRCSEMTAREGPGHSILVRQIIKKAEGVFLWVKLVTDELLRRWKMTDSLERLQTRLNNLPRGLMPFYDRIIDEMDDYDRKEVLGILAFVVCAYRPLSLTDISYALANFDNTKRNLEQISAKWLGEVSRGLLEIKQETIHPSHETVVAFIESRDALGSSLAAEKKLLSVTHLYFLNACIRSIVRLDRFSLPWTGEHWGNYDGSYPKISNLCLQDELRGFDEGQYPFISYSVHYWLYHAKRVEPKLQEPLFDLLQSISGARYKTWRFLASEKDLSDKLIYGRIHHEDTLNPAVEIKNTLLEMALENNLEYYAWKTLNLSTDKFYHLAQRHYCWYGDRLLQAAIIGRNFEMVQLLTDRLSKSSNPPSKFIYTLLGGIVKTQKFDYTNIRIAQFLCDYMRNLSLTLEDAYELLAVLVENILLQINKRRERPDRFELMKDLLVSHKLNVNIAIASRGYEMPLLEIMIRTYHSQRWSKSRTHSLKRLLNFTKTLVHHGAIPRIVDRALARRDSEIWEIIKDVPYTKSANIALPTIRISKYIKLCS